MKKNIPNILTISRLIAIGFFVWLILDDRMTAAGFVFLAASLTDALDGYLARKWKVISKVGTILDPLADRLLLDTTVVLLVISNSLHPIVLILLLRDIVLIFAYIVMRRKVEFRVSYWGKAATALLMLGLVLTLFSFDIGPWIVYVGLGVSLSVFVQYFIWGLRAQKQFKDPV